jgi:transcriptional regulator with XRE-family HTH domain
MKINEAVSKKLLKLCKERNISVNKLATTCCLTQSTVQNIIECNSNNPKLLTIIRICDGLNISLKEFFDDELFSKLDRED